jgi:methyl-accepting chemotaxis protein
MKMLHRLRLGTKLPLMLVSISIVALAIMGFTSYHLAARALTNYGTERIQQTLSSRTEQIHQWSERQLAALRSATVSQATNQAMRDLGAIWARMDSFNQEQVRRALATDEMVARLGEAPTAAEEYLALRQAYMPGFQAIATENRLVDIFLVATNGTVVYSLKTDSNFGMNLFDKAPRDAELMRAAQDALKAKTDATVISNFTQDFTESKGERVVYLSRPLRLAGGAIAGAVVFEVALTPITQMMSNDRWLGETGQGYIVDAGMVLQTSLRSVPRLEGASLDVPKVAVERAMRGESGSLEGMGIDGVTAFSAYAPIDLLGRRYAAVVEQSTGEIFAPANAFARHILIDAFAMVFLMALLSWLMARSVSKPLARLADTIGEISAHNYDADIRGGNRGDEVGDIARALGGLREELQQADAVQREALIQGTAFRTSSAAMMMVDAEFVITYVNEAFIRLISERAGETTVFGADLTADKLIGVSMDKFHQNPTHQRALLADSRNLPYHADVALGSVRFALDINEISVPETGRLGFVVEWRDVTEMQMNRALLNAIAETQVILELSPEGKVNDAKENALRVLGCTRDQILGLSHTDVIANEGDFDTYWARLIAMQPVLGRFVLNKPQGGSATVDGSLTPVPDRNGRLVKVVMIAHDVTDAQIALANERERADAILEDQQRVVEALRIGLTALSMGDLSVQIDHTFPSEHEQLRKDFNAAVANLSEAIQVVIDNAATIDAEAREISNAAEDLSDRTEKQAATLEQTAAALDELTVSVSSATAGVMDANRVVKLARESAENSGEIVQQAVNAMGEIEDSSRRISRIIGVIDDIAFQTNLLALNAGVEAARAGEAGRGFAVVASEVRALAQRSSEAAREIDGLITASSNHVRRGVDLVGETGAALEKILASVNDIASRVSEIAASSHEQASGLSEINIAVNQLDQVTQHNAAMFEETTAASHALTVGAQALAAAAAQFRTARRPNAVDPDAENEISTDKKMRNGCRDHVQRTVAVRNVVGKLDFKTDDWEEF